MANAYSDPKFVGTFKRKYTESSVQLELIPEPETQ